VFLSSMSTGAPAAPSRFAPENRATTPTEVVPLAEGKSDPSLPLELIHPSTTHSAGGSGDNRETDETPFGRRTTP